MEAKEEKKAGEEEDLSVFVEKMLKDMQGKFDEMSKNITGK